MRWLLVFLAFPVVAAEVDGPHCHIITNGTITETYGGDCVVEPPPPPPPNGNCALPVITDFGSHTCGGWPGQTMAVKTGSGGAATNYTLNNLYPGREICLEDNSGFEPDLSIGTARTRTGFLEDQIYVIDSGAFVQDLVVGSDARRVEVRGQINGAITVQGTDIVVNGQCYNGTQ